MAGQILIQRGAVGAGGGGTPGGANTQVQYNDGGAFGGDAGLTFNETTDALTVGGALSAASATLTGLTANAFLYSGTGGLLTTTVAPTDGQLLIGSTGVAPVRATLTAGANVTITNGAGSIQIAAAGGGGGTPGGADTQVQYNDGGAFGGDTGLTFNETTDVLTVVGGLDIDSDAGLLRLGNAQDVILQRDGAADTLALKRGTNTQRQRIYKTDPGGTAQEYLSVGYDAANATYEIRGRKGATGGNAEMAIGLGAPGEGVFGDLRFFTNGAARWVIGPSDGQFRPGADGTYDLGETSNRVRDLHLSRWIQQSETASDPALADLVADAEVITYTKNDKLVHAYNNGGVLTFLSILLDGTTTTWVHSTTAP